MPNYVGDQVEIESSSDTVEQVKAAMASTVEIEESPAEETETEKKPPTKEKAKEEPEPEAGETETEEEETEEETEEKPDKAEAEEEKPKKKATPTHVPLSRLNEVIRKVKTLERQLAERDEEPEPEVKTVAETKPQTYCGRPKPTIDDFTKDPEKYPDPYATFAEAYGDWKVDESDAKREFDGRQKAVAKAREEEDALFKATVPKTLERRADYNDVVNGSDVMIHDDMVKFIKQSDIGPDLLLYFVEHPDEAERVRTLRSRAQSAEMFAIEATLKEEFGITDEVEEEAVPPKKVIPPPKKKLVSHTPPPPNRLKPAGPGPKSLQELAGPADKQGIDIDFNPAYERAVKARRGS